MTHNTSVCTNINAGIKGSANVSFLQFSGIPHCSKEFFRKLFLTRKNYNIIEVHVNRFDWKVPKHGGVGIRGSITPFLWKSLWTYNPASRASFCVLPDWRAEEENLPESRQSFEYPEYPASRGPSIFLDKSRRGRGRDLPLPGLSRKIEGPLLAGYSPNFWTSQFCIPSSNWVFECKHLPIDKLMFTTEPTVSTARILGLGLKLYPSNMQCKLKKDHILFHTESLLAGWGPPW